MLEIIALIFLARKIGRIAERKGVSVGWWRFYTVMAWLAGEFFGVILSFMLVGQVLVFNMLTGIAFAFGGYLLVKYKLDQLPDKNQEGDWIDTIGNNEDE